MEKVQDNPTVMVWLDNIWIVRVSEIGEEFAKWLTGQTLPLVNEDEHPTDWAYYSDYSRWIQHLPIID